MLLPVPHPKVTVILEAQWMWFFGWNIHHFRFTLFQKVF